MKKIRLCSIGLAIVCLLTACASQGNSVNGSNTAGQDRTAASAEAQDSAAQDPLAASAGTKEEAVQGQTAASAEEQDSTAQDLSAAPAGTLEEAAKDQTAEAAGTQEEAAQDTAAGMSSAAETAGSQIPHSSVYGTYVNEENGWYAQYEPALLTVKEEKDDVTFLYKGEASGENYVEIRYISGKEAREVLTAELEQLQDEKGVEDDAIIRDEWYFFGNTWGYIASAEYSDDDGDVTVLYQAAEYNGGVILTKLLEHMTDESVLEREMDVALRKIVETLAFYHYDAQTEFSYVPGTYVRTESDGDAVDKIILKKDHTGTIIFQDQIPVYWGSYLLTEKSTGRTYEYTIEGEMLMLNLDDQWIEFEKTENPEDGSIPE